MMTVTQAERLVRKITEALAQPISDTQAKLAQEYAEVCRTAGRRLEQCALMIEAGQSLQALQLAETPPPLLDLITVLSFRQAAEWRSYCQTHQLPAADPFYDKFVRLLNSAYGKGIASDHPYYRDYRRAVMKNEDEKAISILRVIARMNPSDANTTEELKRMEEKLQRVKLEKLRESVASGNNAAIREQLEQIEASSAPVPASHPVWQQAQVARCQELLGRALVLREKDAWQEAEGLVDEIHTLATHYNVQLPTADADTWSTLEEWTTGKRRDYADNQDFRRALSALEYELQTLEAKRAKNERPNAVETKIALASLSAKWREAARFERPLSDDLAARREQCQRWLEQQENLALRKRRLLTAAIAIVILAVIGAAVPFILDWSHERNFLGELAKLETSRQVAATKTLVNQVPERLKKNPAVAEKLNEAQAFVTHETDLKRAFDAGMSRLQQLANENFRNVAEVAPLRSQTETAVTQMAPEFQTDTKSALAAWDAKWQPVRNAAVLTRLDRAEEIASGLNGTNGYEAVQAALPQVQSLLAELSPLEARPPALDSSLDTRTRKLSDTVALWTRTAQQWEAAQEALARASSLEEYLRRLGQLVQSPFATVAQRDEADEIDRLKINEETLLGELLLPDNRAAWDSLTNAAAWRTTLMPEKPAAQEKDLYFKLRDDKNMQNVYVYTLIANPRPNNVSQTHNVFVQGSLGLDRAGQMSGLIYDPAIYTENARFVPTVYSDWDFSETVRTNRTPECESYERIGLAELIDPSTGNYQKPILQLVDQLNRDDNASSLFRAFVAVKLFELAALRPDEWGLQWCPGAARELQGLKDLGALDLKSGDWMVRVPTAKYEETFAKFFLNARQVPLEKQAALLQQLARETCQTDFSFAGFIDANGRPMLRQLNVAVPEYWGWSSSSESVALLLRRQGEASALAKVAEPLPWTPLFVFNGDRRRLLTEKAQALSYPANRAAAVLPPFFSGL